MKKYTFKGGIFPLEYKNLSRDCAIKKVFPKNNLVVIPVTMGGAANTPLVKVGDIVKRGQLIASGDKPFSVPVHSSINGKVKKISKELLSGEQVGLCITIEKVGEEEEFLPPLDAFSATKDECIKRVREAGIVGMGGASFPSFVKFSIPSNKKVDYLLINAAECEPYLTCDERVMQEWTTSFLLGVAITLHIARLANEANGKKDAVNAIIALEENKEYIKPIIEEKLETLKKTSPSYPEYSAIRVAIVKTKYPQGAEKCITEAVLRREVKAGGLPLDVGCLIFNAGTVTAIYQAFSKGMPLIERVVTFSGEGVNNPSNLLLPIGTLISSLIPSEFSINSHVKKVIAGGPMMGFACSSTSFPVAKGTSGVTFLTELETKVAKEAEESPCINCGHCVTICPMRLYPVLMKNAIKEEDLTKALRFGLKDCIECGSCAAICPASIPLVQYFRIGKVQSRNAGLK